jgi:hypothetical protein
MGASEDSLWAEFRRFQHREKPPDARPAVDPLLRAIFQQGKSAASCEGRWCSMACRQQGWVIEADAAAGLWCCTHHGYMHVCTKDNCDVQFTDVNGVTICVMSRQPLSHDFVHMNGFTLHDPIEHNRVADRAAHASKHRRKKMRGDPVGHRKLSNTRAVLYGIVACFFGNADGRRAIVEKLSERAASNFKARLQKMQKATEVRVRRKTDGRVTVAPHLCRLPGEDEVREMLHAVLEPLDPVCGVLDGVRCAAGAARPIEILRPLCGDAAARQRAESWLVRTVAKMWDFFERRRVSVNAISEFHSFCVYVVFRAAAGQPVEYVIDGRADVLVPVHPDAARCGVPMEWIKAISHLSTPEIRIETSNFSAGCEILQRMLDDLVGKFKADAYYDLREAMYSIHGRCDGNEVPEDVGDAERSESDSESDDGPGECDDGEEDE